MSGGVAPQWRSRKPPVLDHLVQSSIDQSVHGFDPDTGYYTTLHYTGCSDRERANEIKQALWRSAKHLGVALAATVKPADDGTFLVEFTAINKEHARAYVLKKYGTDASEWPYRAGQRKAT
jgi:hypothetical protein